MLQSASGPDCPDEANFPNQAPFCGNSALGGSVLASQSVHCRAPFSVKTNSSATSPVSSLTDAVLAGGGVDHGALVKEKCHRALHFLLRVE